MATSNANNHGYFGNTIGVFSAFTHSDGYVLAPGQYTEPSTPIPHGVFFSAKSDISTFREGGKVYPNSLCLNYAIKS